MKPRKPAPTAKRNTRALARRLFPEWSRHKQAEWVISKLRVLTGRWSHPIGHAAKESADNAPEFLRRLPPGSPLEIKQDRTDKVRGAVRYLKGFSK